MAAMSAETLEVSEPLGAAEVLATSFREYGRRPVTYIAIGTVEALAGLTTYSGSGIPLWVGVLIVAVAFVACFATAVAVASGWSRADGVARLRNGAVGLVGLIVIVGLPATLGRVDAVFTLLAILWLGLTSFSVPIIMREQRDGRRVGLHGMLVALKRSLAMSQVAFMHALVVVLILYVVTVLITSLLAASLGNFGDQTELAAFVISRAVLVPIVFIGLTVLYLDQRARMLGGTGEPAGERA